jgi:hypothetical protein
MKILIMVHFMIQAKTLLLEINAFIDKIIFSGIKNQKK